MAAVAGAVAELDRGFNKQMHLDLRDLYRRIAEDSEVRAVVLTGAGRSFCVGADFAVMEENLETGYPEGRPDLLDDGIDIARGALRVRQPMVAADEAFLLWAIPTWEAWAGFEKARRTDQGLLRWQAAVDDLVVGWHRFLLVDAPLSPFRTGRQPHRSDRIDYEDL